MTDTQHNVLVFSGLDPSGGAGIQADIETLAKLQVHALPIITCLTVQDTRNVYRIQSCDAALLKQQVKTLTADIQASAIKIGLLSNEKIIKQVAETVKAMPTLPVVLDPILKAGGGANLAANTSTEKIISALREDLIPHTTVLTPNTEEARFLTGKNNIDDCASELLKLGCEYVLITGEHEKDPDNICNVLYSKESQHSFNYARLPGQFHGSGCTLASAVSAYILKYNNVFDALKAAQDFTHTSLLHAEKPGKGQRLPYRLCNDDL